MLASESSSGIGSPASWRGLSGSTSAVSALAVSGVGLIEFTGSGTASGTVGVGLDSVAGSGNDEAGKISFSSMSFIGISLSHSSIPASVANVGCGSLPMTKLPGAWLATRGLVSAPMGVELAGAEVCVAGLPASVEIIANHTVPASAPQFGQFSALKAT